MTPTHDAQSEVRRDGGPGQRGPGVSLYSHGWARFNKKALETFADESRGETDPEDYETAVLFLHNELPLFGVRFSTLSVDDACEEYHGADYVLGLGGTCGQLVNARQPLLDVIGVDAGSLDHTLTAEFEYDEEAHLLIADYSVILDHVNVSPEECSLSDPQSLADEDGGDEDE